MEKNRKCVMVMDASLAPGIAANTAALLGMTLGSKGKEAIGCDVQDADGNIHMGILQIPLPILKMETELSLISVMQHKPAMCMRTGL